MIQRKLLGLLIFLGVTLTFGSCRNPKAAKSAVQAIEKAVVKEKKTAGTAIKKLNTTGASVSGSHMLEQSGKHVDDIYRVSEEYFDEE